MTRVACTQKGDTVTRKTRWIAAAALSATIGCAEGEQRQVGMETGKCPLKIAARNGLRTELYDAPPRPYWFLPLLTTEGRRLGLSTGEDSFRVCESIRRSTWNHRNLWVRIEINDTQAWLNAGEMRLEEFLDAQAARALTPKPQASPGRNPLR